LEVYNPTLLDKKELLVLNKTDMVDAKTLKKNLKTGEKYSQCITVSIYDDKSLERLLPNPRTLTRIIFF